jgi:NDP-mannose synthase
MGKPLDSALPPVVLQAGGKGERMAPLGTRRPKVLVPVQGMALLERLIRQLVAEGARQFYIITGHGANEVEAHVLAIEGLPRDVRIHFIAETEPRGNVGSLAQLGPLNTPVLFAFGDLLTTLRFRDLFQIHQKRKCAITLASHFESHRLQLGHLIVENEAVRDYREKPEYEFLICSGIAAIESEVLQCLPKTGSVGMNRMVLLAMERKLAVSHWTHGAFWMDVNTPALLDIANQAELPDDVGKEQIIVAS